ncbi:MAG: NADH-quinone oxidoreductase subunit J [Proteobacteria bacterium]|nr:NADH-quinone oxidoreductase subunit J [Pseudomonadota bacterium]
MSETVALVGPTAWIFAALALVGAALAVSLPNILHAIFSLALSLIGVALLFLSLGSPFVAAMQVLIYVGGISVAMVFAVMFAFALREQPRAAAWRRRGLAGAAALGVFVALAPTLVRARWVRRLGGDDWSVAALGRALLQHYNVVFEALSLVLLLAIVGAIIIARKEPRQ